jgi:hypothetical protein
VKRTQRLQAQFLPGLDPAFQQIVTKPIETLFRQRLGSKARLGWFQDSAHLPRFDVE